MDFFFLCFQNFSLLIVLGFIKELFKVKKIKQHRAKGKYRITNYVFIPSWLVFRILLVVLEEWNVLREN
jgi:hypothetical protein